MKKYLVLSLTFLLSFSFMIYEFVLLKKDLRNNNVVTVFVLIKRDSAVGIMKDSNLVVEVEILDDLSEKNSVFTYGTAFPWGDVADFYALRKARIITVIKGDDSFKSNQIIEVIEPIAINDEGVIYELNEYRYSTRLRKGQTVVLFTELMENNYYSIMIAGNAQINDNLHNGYSALLDIMLNCSESKDINLDLILNAKPAFDSGGFRDYKKTMVVTKRTTYTIYYRFIPEKNVTYIEINDGIYSNSFIVSGNAVR